jgi:hypothetical protein
VNKIKLLILFLIIGVGLTPSLFITRGTVNFPLGNIRAYITPIYLYRYVNTITEYGIPESPYDVTHPPSLNILYGIMSWLSSSDPLFTLYSVPFLLVILLTGGIYLFIYQISKRRDMAIIGCIVGSWVLSGTNLARWPCAADSAYIIYALNPFVFYIFHELGKKRETKVSNVFYAFILCLMWALSLQVAFALNREWSELETYTLTNPYMTFYQLLLIFSLIACFFASSRSPDFSIPFVVNICLVSMHTLSGLSTAFFATIYLTFLKINEANHIISRCFQYGLQGLTFAYITLQKIGVLKMPAMNFLSQLLFLRPVTGYDVFNYKFQHFEAGVGEITLIFFLLGMILLFLSNNKVDRTIATTVCIVLFVYFLSEFWSYRVIDILGLFISYCIAKAIYEIASSKLKYALR